jgi:hypothetical protein
MDTVKFYSGSESAYWSDGKNPQQLTVTINVASGYSDLLPVLQGFDIFFPNDQHQFNRGMFVLSNVTASSSKVGVDINVTYNVMLRDEHGKAEFEASIQVGLIVTY